MPNSEPNANAKSVEHTHTLIEKAAKAENAAMAMQFAQAAANAAAALQGLKNLT